MTTICVTGLAELRLLPDGARLLVPGVAEPLVWLRAYARPHQDPDSGLWRLPLNPFTKYGVTEIEAELPEGSDAASAPLPLRGDEDWLSTLTDPHDSTR